MSGANDFDFLLGSWNIRTHGVRNEISSSKEERKNTLDARPHTMRRSRVMNPSGQKIL